MKMTYDATEQQPDFQAVQLKVASPETILSWSHGEVLKPETINYRTQKPERDGLFCERIFGPTQDYRCYCGKYKSIRYKGVICDKCGVEVTKAQVRRVRMGHIDLAVPVVHIWYLQGLPSQLGMLLEMTVSDLEKIIYFAAYAVLEVNEDVRSEALSQLDSEFTELRNEILLGKQPADLDAEALLKLQQLEADYKFARTELASLSARQVISEATYHDMSLRYGAIVRVGIGAEAVRELLKQVDLEQGIEALKQQAVTTTPLNRRKVMRRLKLFTDLQRAQINPEWFVLSRLPVIPPDLRPMVQLDGGRFAASDLNDLYRRVLNRNNRLKKLLNGGAPEVITRNEKRMLQEAVDSLIDNNARRGKAAAAATGLKRKLKSLSDILRGKQGRFRQNLLGKRVDYSARSVIVVGPNLKLHQCGLPKIMALELFKPFVIGRLITSGLVHNVRNATRLIEQGEPFVWDILEEITNDYLVLLNRAPTLHRLGIQAFQPVLIEGKSIQIHPLVCTAYNADFDGDQMAVHVPLSKEAQAEARSIMLSSHNLLKPASGEVIVAPSKDMILGTYYMTIVDETAHGAGRAFSTEEEALQAYDVQVVSFRAPIKLLVNDEVIETTIGRIRFNQIVPEGLGYVNDVMGKKAISKLIQRCFTELGQDATAQFVDDLKDLGFKYAEQSGITFAISDIIIPAEKAEVMHDTETKVTEIDKLYRRGLITKDEQYVKTVEAWMEAGKKLEHHVQKGFESTNPIMTIFQSGARGATTNLNQIAGMKGLVTNPSGAIIEIPLKHSFKEGLSVFEYFISTHGSRKGRADTALRTADAGYLTRRLVDVSQDVVIAGYDCGATTGVHLRKADELKHLDKFEEALVGRYTAGAEDQAGIAPGTFIDESVAATLATLDVVEVRSPLYCENQWGICQKCYGRNMATGDLVVEGEAVGIIAAQAIGEPGTQLTMKTFHMGGVAQAGGDITSGLPRVEELFEARMPKTPAVMAEIAGVATVEDRGEDVLITVTSEQPEKQTLRIPSGYTVSVTTGDKVAPRDIVATGPEGQTVRSMLSGTITTETGAVVITAHEKAIREYSVPSNAVVLVESGEKVAVGQSITEGHLDLQQLLKLTGRRGVERYVTAEIQRIYTDQGVTIHNKHVEIIIRQMLSKVMITDPGTTEFITGQTIDMSDIRAAVSEGKSMDSDQQLLGISQIALRTKSFLSAASFQQTVTSLIDAAVQAKRDELRGLKENVIIGKLIPAGTGFSSRVSKGENASESTTAE